MEKGSLSVVLWVLTAISKARAQQPCCQPGPPPIPAVYIPPEYEYVRRGDIFVPIFVQIVVGTANSDEDWCPEGNHPEAYDVWYVVRWDDHGSGGEFGYFDEGGRWVPYNGDRTTHYRISRGGEPIEPKVVRISVVVDDYALYADDPPQSSSAWGLDGYFTVWEFWIAGHAPREWRPQLFDTLSFSAHIRPLFDHRGNFMAGHITFHLEASSEPSFCLNICCLGYEECRKWVVETDEQGQERLERKCPLFPLCAWDVGFLWGMPECEWHKFLIANGLSWMATTVWDSDLKFPPTQTGFSINAPACTQATTLQPVTDATVQVMCLDYGAFGTLMATCSHPILGEIQARLPFVDWDDARWEGLGLPFDYDVGIPFDYDLDGIADSWQDKHGEQYAGDVLADADDTPIGDGTDGDGLSAYEEYRGMGVRGVWKEFDPKVKDMFVMNFGAGREDPYEPAVIPNEAIESPRGFPGTGVPGEGGEGFWLLNADEGFGYPLRVVNFLCGYAHRRDVYAAIVVPSWGEVWVYADQDGNGQPEDNDGDGDLDRIVYWGFTYGPIWGQARRPYEGFIPPPDPNWGNQPLWGPPICEIDVTDPNSTGAGLTYVVGHELGHTVLWDEPFYGHHFAPTAQDCFMFQPILVFWPTEFCAWYSVDVEGCQRRWKLNP